MPRVDTLSNETLDSSAAQEMPAPFASEGAAAASRIGADVDGAPGSRLLTVTDGPIRCSGQVPVGREEAFNVFKRVATWTPDAIVIGGPRDRDPLWVLELSEGVTGVTGQHGRYQVIEHEAVQPSRVVKHLVWHRGDQDGNHWPLLDVPIVQTLEFDDSVDTEHTAVSVTVSGLPVEWTEDFEKYCCWQLKLAAAALDRSGDLR